MTPDNFFILFLVFFGVQEIALCSIRAKRNTGGGVDDAYLVDVKKQLTTGIKEIRKLAEKAVDYNSKAGEVATQMAAQAVQIRKTLEIDDETLRNSPDEENGDENSQSSNPTVPEVTLHQIDAQVNYKLYAARKDFALVEKIEQRTAELLQKFSKEGADPEKNRYYEERGGQVRQAQQHLTNYQKFLQKIRIALLKLRNLEMAYKDATGKDFSQIPDWKADGSTAVSLIKSLKTGVYVKVIKETEETDYFIENSETPSEPEFSQRSFINWADVLRPRPNPFGVGMGIGRPKDDRLIQNFANQVAQKYPLIPSKTRNLSLIKCVVTNILTYLGEIYQCIRGQPSPEEPEPEEFIPELQRTPRFPPFVIPIFCSFKPTFHFIIGLVVCATS